MPMSSEARASRRPSSTAKPLTAGASGREGRAAPRAGTDAPDGTARTGKTFDLETASFTGHETFALRYAWPKKAVNAVLEREDAFADDDALARLGVGKNMVRSMRHWAMAARLVDLAPDGKDARGRNLRVTALGQLLFGPGGADPYLEDIGTIWLLHWLITSPQSRATTWRWAFGFWSTPEFTVEGLVRELLALAAQRTTSRATPVSLERDAEVFVRTYVPPRASRTVAVEDTLDCPLVELRLLRERGENSSYAFARGPKPTLSDATFGFALLEYWDHVAPERNSLSFEDALYRGGAPGRVFQLDEASMTDRLERAERWSRGALVYDQTAGLRQLLRRHRTPPIEWLRVALAARAPQEAR